jgi:hypothetical protein
METLADLLEQLGGIAPHRVRFLPSLGLATEEDVWRYAMVPHGGCMSW